MPIIDFKKLKIGNKEELFEEAFRELEKDAEFIVIAYNHFKTVTFAHINCWNELEHLVYAAAKCAVMLSNKDMLHEERIYRRENNGLKLIFRTATVL